MHVVASESSNSNQELKLQQTTVLLEYIRKSGEKQSGSGGSYL
jgi:hypothetical protein